MRRWRLHTYFLALVLLIVTGAVLVSGAGSSGESTFSPSPVIQQLLDGSSNDFQGACSTIKEKDLPIALGLIPIFRFRSLHNEIKASVAQIESFQKHIEERLAKAKTVSLQPTAVCSTVVPARDVRIGDSNFIIPKHFLATATLMIIDWAPKEDIGNLFPDIWVSFVTDKPPVRMQLTLDKQAFPPISGSSGFAVYQPPIDSKSFIGIGTHSVEVTLTDSSGRTVTSSWSFTNGIEPIECSWAPSDAVSIGEVSIGVSELIKDARVKGQVLVRVFKTPDGKRFIEYNLIDPTNPDKPIIKTPSLYFLRKYVREKSPRESLTILPKSSIMFPGYEIEFSFELVGEGSINFIEWKISKPQETPFVSNEPKVPWKLPGDFDSLRVDLYVSVDDGPHHYGVSAIRYIHFPPLNYYFERARDWMFSNSTVASLPFAVSSLKIENQIFKEGDVWNFPSETPGVLRFERARSKIIGGSADAEIADPLATSTSVLFKSQGFTEIVLDLFVTYDFGDEHYEYLYPPNKSALLSILSYKAESTGVAPLGVIGYADRQMTITGINLEINGVKRSISNQVGDYCPVDPPIAIGVSSLFPASAPCFFADRIYPFVVKQSGYNTWFLPMKDMKAPITNVWNTNGTMMCYGYFQWPMRARERFDGLLDENGLFTEPPPEPAKAIPDSYGFYLGRWWKIWQYKSPADIVNVEIEPTNVSSMKEGQELVLTGKVVPRPGFGTGEISETGSNLDLLKGYQFDGSTALTWKADLKGQTKFTADGFHFSFRPGKGTGTYVIEARTEFDAIEKDLHTVARIIGSGTKTILVEPGLRILSPGNGFAYPLGRAIPLRTTIDGNLAEWQKITWSLNGKPWKPAEDEPPAFLAIEAPNDHVILEAKLTSTDSNGQDVELSDKVEFGGKPVSAVISPFRKVVPKHAGPVDLNLSVTLGKSVVENTSTVVGWSDFLKAKVEKVEWSGTFGQGGAGNVSPDPDQFNAAATFEKPGALTTLATVTVKIWSTDPKKPYDETFAFQATRSDVWAIEEPGNLTLNPDDFPKKGIAKAYRTFAPKEITFKIGQTGYTWNPPGTEPLLTLHPAVPFAGGGSGPSGVLRLTWKGPGGSTASGPVFQPLLPDVGEYVVDLDLSLSFGAAGRFPLGSHNVVGEAEDFYSLVKASIDPASFPIWVGQQQKLTFVIEPIGQTSPPTEPPSEPPPVLAKGFILIQDGNFQAEVNSVVWVKDGSTLGTGNPYDYLAKDKAVETITGKGKVKVTEAKTSPVAKPSLFDHSADTKTTIGRIIAYPSNGYVFPASYAVTLQARSDAPDPETIEWSVDGNHVGRGVTVPVNGLSVGTHKIQAVHPGNNSKEERFISVFPWSVSFSPARNVLLAPKQGQAAQQGFDFKVKIKDAFIASGSVVSIEFLKDKDAAVSVSALGVAYVAKEPQCASATVSGQKGTATFSKDGAITILPKGTFSVTQFDGATKEYTLLQKNRADFWAVQQPTWWAIDGHFPLKAILNAKRTFQFKNGEFRLSGDQKYVWAPKKPIDPALELDPALEADGKALVAEDITLFWKKGSENAVIEGDTFTPFLDTAGSTTITLNAKLLFDTGEVEFEPQEFETNAVPLATLVQAFVVPASFSIPVGKTQELNFFLRGDGAAAMTTVTCATKNFEVSLTHLTWQKNGKTFAPYENPTKFSQDQVGSGVIDAIASVTIKELDVPPQAFSGDGVLKATSLYSVRPPPLERIEIRLNGSIISPTNFEIGFRKEQVIFNAFGFGANDYPLGLIQADWRLIGGSATTKLEREILESQIPGLETIGAINDGMTASSTPTIRFTAFLPGNLNIVAFSDAIESIPLSVRIKQPTVYLSIKGIRGLSEGLTTLVSMISKAQAVWLQGNRFLVVKTRHGGAANDSFPWVENKTFTPASWPFSAEERFQKMYLKEKPLSLLYPLAADQTYNQAVSHGYLVFPRTSEEILSTARSETLPAGRATDVNFWLTEACYFEIQMPLGSSEFHPADGWAFSQNSYFEKSTLQRINDHKRAGVFLDTMINPLGTATLNLAHELGHVLIQHPTDVHPNIEKNLMNGSYYSRGDEIASFQAIMILDYDRKKPVSSYFLVGE